MSSAESTSSRVSSKRALFTSPIESKNLLKPLVIAKEISTRGRLPRRSLFSPVNDENKKRRRSTSPDHDVENRGGKLRRLESPTRLPKSQSFSIAPSTSSSNLGEQFRKTLLYRTQSEMISQPGTSLSTNNLNLGYRDPLTVVVKNVRLAFGLSWEFFFQLFVSFVENSLVRFERSESKRDFQGARKVQGTCKPAR